MLTSKGNKFAKCKKVMLYYQVYKGICEEKKAAACLSGFSNQLDSDWLLPALTKPRISGDLEVELQHATIKIYLFNNQNTVSNSCSSLLSNLYNLETEVEF
jgi:hypothetical protein